MSDAPWRVTDVNSGFFHSVLALYTQSSFCLVFCVKLNRKPTGFWVYSYPCFLLSLFCISWPSFHPLLASSAHCTMARSLSAWLRCFLALYPGRRNSIFLFLASILFLCFFSFFFAAMSGFATACRDRRRNCEDDRWQIKAVSRVCLIAMSIIPAWLCVVCVPLVSVRIPSGRQRRPGRISPGPPVSSSARWAPEQGSSVWDLDQRLGDNRGHSVNLTLFVRMVFFILGDTGSEQLPWSAYVLSSSLYSGVIIVVKYGASRSFPKSMAIAPRNLNTHVLWEKSQWRTNSVTLRALQIITGFKKNKTSVSKFTLRGTLGAYAASLFAIRDSFFISHSREGGLSSLSSSSSSSSFPSSSLSSSSSSPSSPFSICSSSPSFSSSWGVMIWDSGEMR